MPIIIMIGKIGSGKSVTNQYLLENFIQYNKKKKTDVYVFLKSSDK